MENSSTMTDSMTSVTLVSEVNVFREEDSVPATLLHHVYLCHVQKLLLNTPYLSVSWVIFIKNLRISSQFDDVVLLHAPKPSHNQCIRHFTDDVRRTWGDPDYLIRPGLFEVITITNRLKPLYLHTVYNKIRSEKGQLHIPSACC